MTISHDDARLSYSDALRIAEDLPSGCGARLIVVDVGRAEEATTAALARLILLRRELLQAGRDLRILGLRSQVEALYEICRLAGLLPRA